MGFSTIQGHLTLHTQFRTYLLKYLIRLCSYLFFVNVQSKILHKWLHMFVTTSESSISRETVHKENNKLTSPEAVYGINITLYCCEKINGFYVLLHLVLNVMAHI